MARSGWQKLGGIMLLAAALSALGILFAFDPRQYHFYPLCLFHQTTGWLCPGCGGLRALHQLLHGHLVLAFRFNPLLVILLASLAGFGAVSLVQYLRHDPRRRNAASHSQSEALGKGAGTACPRNHMPLTSGTSCPRLGRLSFLQPPRSIWSLWLWLFLAASIVISIWRNVPGSPFVLPPN